MAGLNVSIVKGDTTTKGTAPKQSASASSGVKNPVLIACKRRFEENHFDAKNAATIITGELRRIFITNLKKNGDVMTIEALQWYDNIAFNNISYCISTMLQYGSDDTMRNLCKQIIKTCVELVDEYTIDQEYLDEIFDIIDGV